MKTGFVQGRLKPAVVTLCLGATLLSLLAGCDDEKTRNLINQRADEAEKSSTQMDRQSPNKRYNPLVVTDRVWTGSSAMRMHRGIPLPARFETPRGVALVSSDPMTLNDIASAIGNQTGIPVRIADGGAKAAGGLPVSSGSFGGGSGSNSAASGGAAMPVSYEGPLSGLMERTAGYFGVNWRYDGSTITLSKFETRVFVVEALPGTQSVQEGMQDDSSSSGSGSSGGSSGGAGGGGGGSGSSSTNSMTQNSKFNIDIKYWDELGQIVTSMLGGTGSVVISPSVGTITVTTSPEIMHTIADYLATENSRLSRQIAINVEIYSITLTEGMDFNVAFGTALKRLANFGGNFDGTGLSAPATNISGGVAGGGALSVAILNPDKTGSVSDVFTALSGIGDTSKVAKFPLITLNNRPVSRRVGEDISYVAQSTSSSPVSSGITTSVGGSTLVPGTVHQGFSVQLTPRLLDDGRILMQYSLSVIDVKQIRTFNSVCGDTSGETSSTLSSICTQPGTTSVQSPDTINRIFVQQSVLKSGATLIMGGAEEEDLQQNSQGVGNPYNYLLGGGVNSAKSHTMLIMAITPQVLDVPHSEND